MSSYSINPTVGLKVSQLAEVDEDGFQLVRKCSKIYKVPEFVIPTRNRWTPGDRRGSGGNRKLCPKVIL